MKRQGKNKQIRESKAKYIGRKKRQRKKRKYREIRWKEGGRKYKGKHK